MKLKQTFITLLLLLTAVACNNFDPFEDTETYRLSLGVYNQVVMNQQPDVILDVHNTTAEARQVQAERGTVLIENGFKGDVLATFTINSTKRTLTIESTNNSFFILGTYPITSISGGVEDRHLHFGTDTLFYRFEYIE